MLLPTSGQNKTSRDEDQGRARRVEQEMKEEVAKKTSYFSIGEIGG